MGRTVLLMIALLTIVVGGLIVSINKLQIKLASNLDIDYNMQMATLLSLSGIYNTIKKTQDLNVESYKLLNQKNINNIDNSTRDLYFTKLNNYLYLIKSIATVQTARCSTRSIIRRMPYSLYALFVNSFPNSYYGTGLSFNGPVYVNGNLGIGQVPGPIFYDNVYCTKEVKYYNNASKKNFKGFKASLYLNYEVLNMPTDNTKLGLSSIVSKGLNIDNAKYVILLNLNVYIKNKDNSLLNITISDLEIPMLYKSINLPIYIYGIINRLLTIGTQGIVYIIDNILYDDLSYDKQLLYYINEDSKSLLTIMSNNNILIHKDANANTLNTTYNVIVCANLFTTKSIVVDLSKFEWKGTNLGGGKYSKKIRKFIVVGSRTQNTLDSKTYDPAGQYGLALAIMYDKRMKYRVPVGMSSPNKSLKIIDWHQIKIYGVK